MVQQQAFQQQQMVVGYVPKYVEVDVPTYDTVQVVNQVPMQQVRSMMKTTHAYARHAPKVCYPYLCECLPHIRKI